jgi:hypothetical protein
MSVISFTRSSISKKFLVLKNSPTGLQTLISEVYAHVDRFCGLVVRVPGYRSTGPGSIPGAFRFSEGGGSRTRSTQPREYN